MSISAGLVKELRERTSAGILDCKKALSETNGDIEQAIDWLKRKGLNKADKKASRSATEGAITSYIHGGGKIGVLLEVNSETDFAAKNDTFKSLCHDISLHIAAMNPQYVSEDEIPTEEVEKQKDILKSVAIEQGKNPDFLDKILDGQLKKWKAEICLMSQAFVKDNNLTVTEFMKQNIVTIGENIVIRRFVRWELSEGLVKEEKDFAQEVAEQMKN